VPVAFMYNIGMYKLAKGELDLSSANLGVALLNESSTAGSEPDVTKLADFSTLGEITAKNYERKTLTSLSVTQDDGNNQVAFTAGNLVYEGLGGDGQDDEITAELIYLKSNDDDDEENVPLFYMEIEPLHTNGSDVNLNVHADGVMLLKNKASS